MVVYADGPSDTEDGGKRIANSKPAWAMVSTAPQKTLGVRCNIVRVLEDEKGLKMKGKGHSRERGQCMQKL